MPTKLYNLLLQPLLVSRLFKSPSMIVTDISTAAHPMLCLSPVSDSNYKSTKRRRAQSRTDAAKYKKSDRKKMDV